MSLERWFKVAGDLVLPCWLLLIFVPRWRWSQRLATFVGPLLLAGLYAWLFVSGLPPNGGSFGSLAQVRSLFGVDRILLAGWIHYLIFDLFTGAWESRDAAGLGISQWLVLPCLLLTFLFGPIGLALYLLLRFAMRRKTEA